MLTTMQTALILPTKWSAPPSVNIPRRANELKRAKQPSGTANASNTRRFMVTSPATPPVPNPTTAHQLNNAVQKICSVSAFWSARPGIEAAKGGEVPPSDVETADHLASRTIQVRPKDLGSASWHSPTCLGGGGSNQKPPSAKGSRSWLLMRSL